MNDKSFNAPGIAALALAILFPIYWLYVLSFAGLESDAFWASMRRVDLWDGLFVLIGVLEIAVYLALRKFLANQLNASLLSALLLVMSGLVAVFHALVVVDVVLAVGLFSASSDALIGTAFTAGLVILYLFAIASLIFSIVLLTQFIALSTLMKVFGIGLLIASVCQLTVVLGGVNIFLFPALMIILAVQFFRGEQTVEVV